MTGSIPLGFAGTPVNWIKLQSFKCGRDANENVLF